MVSMIDVALVISNIIISEVLLPIAKVYLAEYYTYDIATIFYHVGLL